MRVLVGYIIDGKSSGIDKHLLHVLDSMKGTDIRFDFLTNQVTPDLKRLLKSYGAGVVQIPSLKHPLQQYRTIKRLIRKYHYDIAYFNISEALNFIGIMAAYHCGVKKIVVHSHSSQVGGANPKVRAIKTKLHYFIRPFITKMATDYYACSEVSGHWMYDDRARHSGHYHVLYNSVDIDKFAFDEQVRHTMREELGVEDKTVIGHVGSYSYAKNNFFLLDIIEKTIPLVPNAILLAVGDGADLQAVKEQAKQRHLDEYIRFMGVRSDVPSLLQAMDFFVLPSRFEGHPISAIEAQMSGLKVIISDTVTKEAVLSDYCVQLPINQGADVWAKYIADEKDYHRLDVRKNPEITEEYDVNRYRKAVRAIFNEGE